MRIVAVAVAALCVTLASRVDLPARQEGPPGLDVFLRARSPNDRDASQALKQIAAVWKDSYASMIYDMARLVRGPRGSSDDLGADQAAPFEDAETPDNPRRPTMGAILREEPPVRARLLRFLEQQTRQRFRNDLAAWQRWIWTLPYNPHPEYVRFKGLIYRSIDPAFEAFFPPGMRSLIRLDEIDWGGVVVNGIPPLDYPKHIPASQASYLGDGNVVFGISLNGESRAYPKRILAWHEMARDRIGGVELTVVYCTLCGTVIPYHSVIGGKLVRFGTSGLLYRSNKLMFDEETRSLWSTLEGKPVVGPLVDSGLTLTPESVVTTTWREWRQEHPDTTVLSIDTGFRRNYSEGHAYRDYFANDRLMFQVSRTDQRLRNKAEVVVMRLHSSEQEVPVAIAVDLLRRQPVFHFDAAGQSHIVITTRAGANRVYRVGGHTFDRMLADGVIVDRNGGRWRVTEDALVSEARPEERLVRQTAQRAFWFGWHAQFPSTILFK
ncbi:MAG: DUF3179 domain-containing protein [Vicinamibacterales bacterium]